MIDKSSSVTLPQMAWYGDSEFDIDFPACWDVNVCYMEGHDAPVLNDSGIREAFDNPIGTGRIRDMARGKSEVVILFDDLARATPTHRLIPYVLEELAAADIRDDQVRFVAAIGAHGAMNGIDLRKKLGDEVMARFLVYNHNPYENCTPLGPSSQGTPIQVNAEVMACDFKIAIGSIVPHHNRGFSGGSKIILPGVSSMDTIEASHSRLVPSPSMIGTEKYEPNISTKDMDEAARMAGLDVKIDAILNLKRDIVALFVGDVVEEHVAGSKFAQEHYATDVIPDCDVVVANCYSKANEMPLGQIVTRHLLKEQGGDMVLLVVTPEGQITHYLQRSFGKNVGGRRWMPKRSLNPRVRRLTIMQPYPDRVGVDWVAAYELVNFARSWPEVLRMLKRTYGDSAKVAVIPDATIQYFPEKPYVC